MAPKGNTQGYAARRCECGRWVLQTRDRCQWQDWNPGVITGDDLAVAIICRRVLTRLTPTSGAPVLADVWLGAGITSDGQYLEQHDCMLAPISERAYRPLQVRSKRDLQFMPEVTPVDGDPWAAIETTTAAVEERA